MITRLRVWWIPQVPGKPFHVGVRNLREARLVIHTLANYDTFQFNERIKPDFCNAGGLQGFDPEDDTDSPEGSWTDWYDEVSGMEFDDLTGNEIDALDAARRMS